MKSELNNSIDALLPAEMAEKAEHVGLAKFAAPSVFWEAIARTPSAFPHLLTSLTNLLWVTVGNMIGGMFVGITYWFIYLRKSRTPPSKPQ